MEIISEELIPNRKAKEVLEMRENEGEVKLEQKNSLEILRKFVKLNPHKTEELIVELKKIERVRDRQIVLDILSTGKPGDRRAEPVVQGIAERYFSLLEVVLKWGNR